MSNVTAQSVRDLHDPIPATSLTRIAVFITDHEAVVKSKLAAYVAMWTDATEPAIVRVIIKYMACWTEMQALYGSQVEEVHDFVLQFKDFPWDVLHEIIDSAKEGQKLDDDFTELVTSKINSNTSTYVKIFDLGEVLSQAMHPQDADKRYGEDDA